MTYDALRQPTDLFMTENGTERLVERTVYGEAQGDAGNHRTRVHQVFDGAGIVTSVAYDFKGNFLKNRRDLLPNFKVTVDWQQNPCRQRRKLHTPYDVRCAQPPLHVITPDNTSISRPSMTLICWNG